MLRRLSVAVLAAAIFAASGAAALLATTAPALADRDDHNARPKHHNHANRGPNPYGANGYWSHGAWHNRLAANPGRHLGWYHTHPIHPKRKVKDHDRDHDHR